jgi:hypothetical protein
MNFYKFFGLEKLFPIFWVYSRKINLFQNVSLITVWLSRYSQSEALAFLRAVPGFCFYILNISEVIILRCHSCDAKQY